MMKKVSQVNGTVGIWNVGKSPATEAISPTVRVSTLNKATNKLSKIIATSVDGTAFVSFGKN